MKANLISMALVAFGAAVAAPAFAQSEAQCIVAGRLSAGRWAPHFAGVELLGAHGQAVTGASKQLISAVSQVRLAQPALLSRCNGDQPLVNADNEPAGTRTDVPALSAGVVDVEGVGFLKLRAGGELVELRVRAPVERIVMLMR